MTLGWGVSLVSLVLGVGVIGLSALGLVRARNVFDRLHYGGPANIVGPLAVTLTLAVSLGVSSPTTLRGILIALLLIITGPIVTHATARAARLRGRGTLDVHPNDAGAPR